MSSKQPVTVIGAGIIGIACASWLQRDGHTVTVIDRGEPGDGCSFGNAGLLSPGAVVPPALPGAWRNIPRWLLDPDGPLVVRRGYAPRLLPWLAGWLRACRPQRALDVSAALRALHVPVFDNYAALLGAAGMADLVRRSGQLYVSARPDGALGDAFVRELRERAGLEVEALSGGALRELEPALGEQYRSGLYFRRNGHCVNPLRLVKALAEAFRRGGGTILRRTVSGFENGPGGPRRLLTDAGALPLQTVVIAAGAWSARLAAGLGMRFPLEAERGYHLMLPAPGVMPRIPLVNRDHHFTVTPMENGLRLAGTAEFAGLDAAPDYRRSRMLLERARRMLPGVDGSGASEWMGCRPSLPDGLPVIGRAPHRPSVLLAFGHAHFGLTEAPTTGRLIADLVAGREPAIDIGPYRAQRFLRGE